MADILSQDEVDLLLGAVSEGEIGDAEEEAQQEVHLTAYDFRRPERVSKEQLKGLQSLFEAFSREVSILFPPFLRTVVRVDLTSIDQLTYDEFILSVARPTALSIINMSPLEGTAVIEMSPSMVFPIVDRVLGGKGMTLPEPRELTEIENRIIQRIVMMLLDSLRRSWEQLIEFRLSVLQQESDPLIVQIVAGSEMVILVGYEVHIGETVGSGGPNIDIALDPIGGMGGGTTTCDALWMGAPVVTLAGNSMKERMTASMLDAIGRPEWIAATEAEYIDKAVTLARDVEMRRQLRSSLRERMRKSPLCDAAGLARSLEYAYEAMYDAWRHKQPSAVV